VRVGSRSELPPKQGWWRRPKLVEPARFGPRPKNNPPERDNENSGHPNPQHGSSHAGRCPRVIGSQPAPYFCDSGTGTPVHTVRPPMSAGQLQLRMGCAIGRGARRNPQPTQPVVNGRVKGPGASV
jgi:hypothetical protein